MSLPRRILVVAVALLASRSFAIPITVVDGQSGQPVAGASVGIRVLTASFNSCGEPQFKEPAFPASKDQAKSDRPTNEKGQIDITIPDLSFKSPCPEGAPCRPYPTPPRRYAYLHISKPGYETFHSAFFDKEVLRLMPIRGRKVATRKAAIRFARNTVPIRDWLRTRRRDYTPVACASEDGAWLVLFEPTNGPSGLRDYELPTLGARVNAHARTLEMTSCPEPGTPVQVESGEIRDKITGHAYRCKACGESSVVDPASCKLSAKAGETVYVSALVGAPWRCDEVGDSDISFGLVRRDLDKIARWKRGKGDLPPFPSLGYFSGCTRVR